MALTFALPRDVQAEPPAGYYDAVDASSSGALRGTLHDAIDDHTRFPYTSTATDTWNILELADEDPNEPGNVLEVYRNESYPKFGEGNDYYNREHSWPKSYGFPDENASNYPYTDCHMLFLSDSSYNSSRGNNPYRSCDASCDEKPTVVNNGQGGGSGVYPGNSNWRTGSGETGTWEVWPGRRGDLARALLYADVRYEGGLHGVTGVSEPDLVLCDDEAAIAASNTGYNIPTAYMGMLSELLLWHYEDPVDDVELNRNEIVYSFQGNRNPFVDHPEWVECLFEGTGCESGCQVPEDCDDGDACTTDTCDQGSCAHAPVVCDDGDACTTDSCDALSGACIFDPVVCDDASACTLDSCDALSGACVFDAIVCDDGDACTTDSCDGALGCVFDAIVCDDGDACTTDSCDSLLGCAFEAIVCPEGESCVEGSCLPETCNDNGVCEEGEDCLTCPSDCVSGQGGSCGDGVCQIADGEDCASCPGDCPGTLGGKPSKRYCCGSSGEYGVPCSDPRCSEGGAQCSEVPAAPSCCGDGTCEGSEDGLVCAVDCGAPAYCGDGSCDPDEDSCDCPADCGGPSGQELTCDDDVDDDCDGLVDCDDPECDGTAACPQCAGSGEVCSADGECCSGRCKKGVCR